MILRILIVATVAVALSGCANYRYGGTGSCAPDGSVVWWEAPNSDGSFDNLENSPDNC
jgi:hypothetical protein